MIKLIYIFFITIVINIGLFANENKVDCIVLKDENSIICKYTQQRVNYQKNVTFNWIEPNGQTTREKELIVPAGHGSVYDYRYIYGRTSGVWTLKVIDDKVEYKTNFTIE
jgi:hypothetical protein